MHGKLRFVVKLPRNVTFYDEETLTSDNYHESDQFVLEYQASDDAEPLVLTPRSFASRGDIDFVKVPDWGSDDFSNPDYAKPDVDDPDDVPGENVKPKDHDGEMLIVEVAAPSDADDDEFARYDTLLDAMCAGVHADGYFRLGLFDDPEAEDPHRQCGPRGRRALDSYGRDDAAATAESSTGNSNSGRPNGRSPTCRPNRPTARGSMPGGMSACATTEAWRCSSPSRCSRPMDPTLVLSRCSIRYSTSKIRTSSATSSFSTNPRARRTARRSISTATAQPTTCSRTPVRPFPDRHAESHGAHRYRSAATPGGQPRPGRRCG